MNKVFLSGRLTKDPEVKYSQGGNAYARVGIAVDRAFSKNKEVDKKKTTAIIIIRKDVVFMADLGYTRFGITTKFEDANQNAVSKTYNGLNLTNQPLTDAQSIKRFFVSGITTIGGASASMFELLGDDYSVKTIDRNANNEVILP